MMKRNYILGKIGLLLVVTCMLLAACKDNEGSYFARNNYYVSCFLDSDKIYSLEEIVGRALDASCEISVEYDDIVELQIDKEIGKHIIIPKELGFSHLYIMRGDEKVAVMIQVKTAAIDFWKIEKRVEKIDCASDISEEICSDIYQSQVLPQLNVGEELYFGYGGKGKWTVSFSGYDSGDNDKTFYVDYVKGESKYMFYSFPNKDKKQVFTFSLDDVQRPLGGEVTKFGAFTCDLTDYYQQKYGQDKVKKVILSYEVRSFRMAI